MVSRIQTQTNCIYKLRAEPPLWLSWLEEDVQSEHMVKGEAMCYGI